MRQILLTIACFATLFAGNAIAHKKTKVMIGDRQVCEGVLAESEDDGGYILQSSRSLNKSLWCDASIMTSESAQNLGA
jgi:hypothetical protein